MKKLNIGTSDIVVSAIGLGTWAIGGDANWGSSDDRDSIRTIHRAGELGITLLDTAPAYGLGHSEEIVGKAVAGRRDDFVIATKCGLRWDTDEGTLQMERDGIRLVRNTSSAGIRREVQESLRRLGTDYIDLYIVHWPATPEFPVPIAETMEALLSLKQAGTIRAIGASNLSLHELEEYTAIGGIDLVQEKYSILDTARYDAVRGVCRREGISFQAYSPLERGALSGKYRPGDAVPAGRARTGMKWFQREYLECLTAILDGWKPLTERYHCTLSQLVLAWTVASGGETPISVLSGARRPWQIEENAGGGAFDLQNEDVATMRADAATLPS